jgi:5'-3' exonuclease
MTSTSKMVALIDGDIVVYRCGFAAEKTKYLVESEGVFTHALSAKDAKEKGGTVWSRKELEPVEVCLQAVNATIDSILRKLEEYYEKPFVPEIYISEGSSFREQIAKTRKYKGNRDGQQRPTHYSAIRESLVREFGACLTTDGLEADDLLGIRSTSLGDTSVIVSIDKDLLQIPGQHYNWVSDTHRSVSKSEGDIKLGSQLLSGDPTDNIPGLPGMGETKAARVLQGVSSKNDLIARVKGIYSNTDTSLLPKGADPKKYFLEMGNLVYILRKEGDSFGDWLRNGKV